MIRKIPSFIVIIALLFLLPFSSFGQEAEYFTNRLIVKFESDQKLQQIRSKSGTHPQDAVQRILNRNGARTVEPLLSNPLQQSIKQRNLPSVDDVLRIREVFFSQNIDPIQLAAKISKMPGVEYAEPRHFRYMNLQPNDSHIEKYIPTHNFFDAWDISQGSRDIVIAINDGGVGYTHIDLDDNLWINQGEVPPTIQPEVDQDENGTVTSTEVYEYLQENGEDYNDDDSITLEDAVHEDSPFTTGADSDNNGFNDDLFGWDFWSSGGAANPDTDNNPIHDGTDHGTHVAGIAAAETNNDTAIAGASFNTTYMAVKTGGIANVPGTPNDESRIIGFGFEGIVYAAVNGADIINCSWSGENFSEAEEEVINLTTEMGALIVAAAGNESSAVGYPAAYDRVLAVGSVNQNESVAFYSNYGYKLDVLATGTEILSTSYFNDLHLKTGTSMSAPVVSGLAALVKDVNPTWPPERIGMQIRSSASFIDADLSESYHHRLGHGSIDAFRAVSTNLPGIKIISHDFVNNEGDNLLAGEPGLVQITLANYGNTTSGLEVQLETLNDGGIELGNTSQQLGPIATGDTEPISFELTISDEYDLREIPTFRVNFADPSENYEDFNVVQYEDLLYDILAANNVKMSLATDGTIGFTDPLAGQGGVGFVPRMPDGSGGYTEGDNILFEGGLMMEVDGEMYDAVREEEGLSRDFIPQQGFIVTPDGNNSTGSGSFVTDTDTTRWAFIDLQAYAFDDPEISNVVFLEYTIQNPSEFVVMEDVYAGLFNDWDIGNNPSNNNASYIEADSLLYLSDAAQSSSQPVVAVAHLGPISGALAIDNASEGGQDSLNFGIYDGFTDNEKSTSLKSGTERTEVQNTDVSAVVASGPYTIDPGAEVTVGFVYAFGDDVDQLRNQIAAARSRNLFAVSPTGRAVPDVVPDQTTLFQNYPNPFSSSTQLRIDLEQTTDVTLSVFDVIGRKVRVLADREFEAGSHFIRFNAEQLSSGTYFVRLETEYGVQSIPMTLIK